MMRQFPLLLLSAAALALGGCATAVPPVEVTRFHSNAPAWPTGTRYQVEIAPLGDASQMVGNTQPSLEWSTYRLAVERQLQLQGYAAAPEGAAAPIKLRIGFDRSQRPTAGKRSPVSVGVGGSTGGYGSGVGLGIGLNLGGGGSGALQDLSLFVRLDDSATGQAIWEGRAITSVSSKAPAAQPSLAAAKLAEALFKDFPGQSGQTITVP